MDLKECLVIYCFCVVNLTALSFSVEALAGEVTDLPYGEGQPQLSVDTTDSGKCKADITKWIPLGILCAVIVGIVIYCFYSEKCKCKRENTEERRGILSSEDLQNLLDVSQAEFERMRDERDFFEARGYREDVILDPSTAHPRLEVSHDGQSVRDTGKVLQVPYSEERFDSHMFVLAKEYFAKGKHYWEVEVGLKTSWDLGVASATISKKGKIKLAPQNGYWVIGLDSRNDYWARTNPWIRVQVSGKPTKIGMFLDISDKKLSFFDVKKKSKLYTFTNLQFEPEIFYPFFSTGSVGTELDTLTLKILKNSEE